MGIIAKNDSVFVDEIAKAMESKDINQAAKIRATMAAFLMQPKALITKKIQAVGVSTDFAQLTSNAYNVTIQEDNFDLGYEQAFRSVPLGQNQDFWEIYDVQNGLTFRKVAEGNRIQVDELSGSKITAYVDYYGGALGWTDKMIRYRKVAAMLDMAMIFRNRFWTNKADNHYALLAAAAAGNVTTWQGAGSDQLQRDIQTLNMAAFTLGNRCKDKGYGDMASARFVMYYNPRDKARVLAAINATYGPVSTAGIGQGSVIVSWNITPIPTFNASVVAGSPILVLPLNKIQRADDMAPTTFTQPKDPLTLNELQAVWAIYGAIVGDTDQAQELTLG